MDLSRELWGTVFEPLRDVEYFGRFTVHPELKTLFRHDGADFAPEFLHDAVRVATCPNQGRQATPGGASCLCDSH